MPRRLRPFLAIGLVFVVTALLVLQGGSAQADSPVTVRVDNNTPVAIPDLATATSVLSFPAEVKLLPVQKVTVSLHITHTWDDDLDISLSNGSGTTINLSSDNGGSGDNYGTSCADGSRTVFDQASATSITAGTAPFAGSFRPEQSLNAFNNQLGAGSWTLRIADDAAPDVGTLHCWSLIVEFGSGPGPVPTAPPSPGPSIPGLPAMQVSGQAFIGLNPAPAGTQLQARIGATVCGTATVGGGGNFNISVRSISQQAGCGLMGESVSFRLGGQPAISNPPAVNFQAGGALGGVQVVRP